MLDFTNSERSVTIEDILGRVSEFDIFKRYCENFEDINLPFCSTLRVDNKPGCRIYITSDDKLRYKDFASGEHFSCWNYIMAKYSCTYHESLRIVSNDFGITSGAVNIDPQLVISRSITKLKEVHMKVKSSIEIINQPFNITDYDYWNQFGIDFDTLSKYNVSSAKTVCLYTRDGMRYIMDYRNSNPSYAYKFTRGDDISYKVYWPLSADKKKKWLFSGEVKKNTEGFDQLPERGELLILTKSLKDVMCYSKLGYSAISLQGEGQALSDGLYDILTSRFDKIVVNYDEDEEGINASMRFKNDYKFNYYFVDGQKDLSDYIKTNSLDKAKTMITDKLNNLL